MKDLKYYVSGIVAVGIFVWLLFIWEKDMANQLFQSLILILAFVFGLNSPTPKVSESNEDEKMLNEILGKN